jgi:DnaK suppressor protein
MAKTKKTEIEAIDKVTLDIIKKDLLARREKIVAELKEISGNSQGGQAKFPDFGDKSDESAQEIGEYSTNLATEKVLENTLRDINNALDRIAKNKYGTCKYCGEPINKKRLLARPVASACVKCKTKLQSAF